VQLERLISRDGLSPQEAEKRIAAQMPQEEKMKHANFLIDTSEGFERARTETETVFRQLQALSDKL
jgi:dephospho-CoA kinase